jgi:hypothetical protein
MILLAIDPGPVRSAWVVLHGDRILNRGIDENITVLDMLERWGGEHSDHLAIEMVACYGMAVGESIFETALWTGRFIERWGGSRYTKVKRLEVKMNLCHDSRAKDANIRRAILDRYPATGGGATPQVGTRGQPGPLYGVKRDMWSALAVGLTWLDAQKT